MSKRHAQLILSIMAAAWMNAAAQDASNLPTDWYDVVGAGMGDQGEIRPPWIREVMAFGGAMQAEWPGWVVPDGPHAAGLEVILDPDYLPGDLALAIYAEPCADGELSFSLLDDERKLLDPPGSVDLLTHGDGAGWFHAYLPVASLAGVCGVRLSGRCVLVGHGLFVPLRLPRAQLAPDWNDELSRVSATVGDAGDGHDESEDTVSQLDGEGLGRPLVLAPEEGVGHTALRRGDGRAALYVDVAYGDDRQNGRAALADGANGPKRTISAGLAALHDGDWLIVAPGCYGDRPSFGGGRLVLHATGPVVIQ